MNTVQLVGRLTRDPDFRVSDGGSSTCRLTVACDRRFKKDGQPSADFIPCVAFGKTAEFIDKYFFKGNRIGVTGRIQTGSYQGKDGNTVYTTDVVIDSVEFVESKDSSGSKPTKESAPDDQGFVNVPDNIDDELPFA